MAQPNKLFLFKSNRKASPLHFTLESGSPGDCPELTTTVHWHDYFEFEIVISGTTNHLLNGKTYPCSRGSAHLLRYSDFHTHQITSDEKVNIYIFNFDEDALPEDITNYLLTSTNPLYYHFDEDELQNILDDINILRAEDPYTDNLFDKTLQTAIFTKILITFLRKCNRQGSVRPADSRFNNAAGITLCRFREDITLTQLAKAVGLSTNYLGQQFKIQFGKSFNDYLKTIRLTHAKHLLENSDLSVADVSDYSGFKNPSYFIQCFKDIYGITPKQYLKKLDEEKNYSNTDQ